LKCISILKMLLDESLWTVQSTIRLVLPNMVIQKIDITNDEKNELYLKISVKCIIIKKIKKQLKLLIIINKKN